MTVARSEVVADGEIGAYHCMARCVRRAFLCGRDPYSGKSYHHRKQWVRDRLELLAGIFAIDIGGYAVMDNHLHVLIRTRPDVLKDWTPQEISRRWRQLYGNQPITRAEKKIADNRIENEAADAKLVATRRARLSSVSWFMRCLIEPISRRANREDNCKGRFWEGRFRCQALLDDAAVLACSTYVDLNPVRAKLAKTPESSQFTSSADRIAEHQKPSKSADLTRDGWLAPFAGDARAKSRSARRATNDAWVSLNNKDYLNLLDWTGRQIRLDKAGAIPADLLPIFERLHLQSDNWLGCVANFGRWFQNAAGSVAKLRGYANSRKRHYFKGVSQCLAAFG